MKPYVALASSPFPTSFVHGSHEGLYTLSFPDPKEKMLDKWHSYFKLDNLKKIKIIIPTLEFWGF